MEKILYSGLAEGFYALDDFRRFVDGLGSDGLATMKVRMDNTFMSLDVISFRPLGVTLLYINYRSKNPFQVDVQLIGSSDGVSSIENLLKDSGLSF